MYSQIRLTRLSSTGCFLSSRSPVTSSLQSLYNMKHILAYTSSFVKSRLHIDQPQILHRSFFNDSSCKSINIRFAFPTSQASVCQSLPVFRLLQDLSRLLQESQSPRQLPSQVLLKVPCHSMRCLSARS